MDVRCERCREGYVVDDARVPEAGVKVACPKCGHGFLLRKRVLAVAVPLKAGDGEAPVPITDFAPAEGGAVSPGAGADRAEWRLRKGSGAVFPFRELSTLQRWIVERKASADDQVAAGGAGEDWRRLGDIPELRSFFAVLERPARDEAPRAEIPPSPGTEDPAWAQDPGPPPRVTASLPPLPRRRRRIVWVALLALGLLVVAAGTVFLRRKADADAITLAAAGPPPVPAAVPAPVAVKPVDPAPPPPAAMPTAPSGPATSVDAGTASPSGPHPEGDGAAAPAPPATPAPSAPAPVVRAAPRDEAGAALRGVLARAREQRERGRCEEALDLYGQALAIDGRNATALAGRGACYLDLSRYAQAEASFEGALDSDPRNAEALFGLAETYRYMGRKAEAVAGYEKFLAVRPTGDDAAAARRLISQLKE